MSRSLENPPCHPPSRSLCGNDAEPKTYAAVVVAYERDYKPGADDLHEFFARCDSIERAIEYAARCKLRNGKRHPHQRRIPAAVLAEVQRQLLGCVDELGECKDFDELHELISARIGVLHGIGALTVYDVANHLGAYLGKEPDRVYLHAGVTDGARALGLDCSAGWLEVSVLPAAFHRLRPHELEDCLCIYKEALQAIRT